MDIKVIHEAAHCIAAMVLEIEFVKVTIEITAVKILNSDNKYDSALILPNIIFNNFDILTKEQKITLVLSGSAAEAIFTKENISNSPCKNFIPEFSLTEKAKYFLTKNTNDYKEYSKYAASIRNLDEDINKTIELMKENWDNILIVAQYLEINKTSTYDEVKKNN